MKISDEQLSYYYEVSGAGAQHLEPGNSVVVRTQDARAGSVTATQVRPGTAFDFPIRPHGARSNPLSGPLVINGAEPGDALVVSIEDIKVDDVGWCGGRPIVGIDAMRIPHALTRLCTVEGQVVRFSDSISLPAAPMIGCIGTAPAGERVRSENPGRHGGNMDHKVIRAGSQVYLPVAHAGAYLYLGDVHAIQGDGELSGVGLEISAEISIVVDVIKDCRIGWPWAEADGKIMVLTCGPNFPQARREAIEAMLSVVETQLGLAPAESLALISLAGDLRIGQACGGMDITVRLEMPASLGLHPA